MKKKPTFEDLKMVPQPRIEESLEVKHKYTDKELLQILAELNEAETQLEAAEEGFKAAKSEWKSRIEGIEAEKKEVLGRSRNGYEMRPTQCIVILDPKKKVKHFHDAETMEKVATQPMTQSDFQTQMDFERDHGDGDGDLEGEE